MPHELADSYPGTEVSDMSNIIIFEQGSQPVEVRLEGETVWLSQAQMVALFDTSTDNISLNLKNIYRDNELEEKATAEDFLVVRQEDAADQAFRAPRDGRVRPIDH